MSTNIFSDFIKAGFKPIELSLIANKDNLFLEKDVYIDDELVESGRSHSLTNGFIHMLWHTASQGRYDLFNEVVNGPNNLTDLHIWSYGITNSGDGTRKKLWVEIDGTGTPDTFKWSYSDYLSYPPSSWNATGVPITGDIQDLTAGIKILFSNTTGHTVGGRQGIAIGGGIGHIDSVFWLGSDSNYPYETSIVFDASNQAVHLFDHYPISIIRHGTSSGRLQYASASITAPAVDATSAQITITRSASNGSGSPVNVNGFVLWGKSFVDLNYPNYNYDIIARDVFSTTKTVNAGSTITVNSRIKTSLGASGGFVRQFIDLLYRNAANTSYSATNIYNSGINEGGSRQVFTPLSIVPYKDTYGWDYQKGLVVGTDSTSVAMTNVALGSIIPHGSSTGQLRWFGTIVDPPYYDLVNKTVKFDMIAAFKNDSGGAITVKEVGWYATSSNNSNTYLVARMVNSSGYVTVNNGDGLIVKMTVGIQL